MYTLFTLTLVALVSTVFSNSRPPPVIVLSFEGFHPNYMTESDTPHLYNVLFPKGAGPSYMTSIFPSKTFVTHFTLSTGVYPETHGVYNNKMFDRTGNVIENKIRQFQFNQNISPIWIENIKAGRHSAVMMWPGSEFEYNGTPATFSQPYDKSISWEVRGNKIAQWMTHDDDVRPNLVMAYFENVPCNDKRKREQHFKDYKKKVDDTIKLIYDRLKKILKDTSFDMIIMSDHGTQQVEHDKIILLDSIFSTDPNIKLIVSGPLVFVRPNEGFLNSVLTHIQNNVNYGMTFEAFTKDSFSTDLKMKTENLNGIIVLVAKYGYTFLKNRTFQELVKEIGDDKNNLVLDESGYNSVGDTNMNTFFLGIGPSFKQNVMTEKPFNVIDVYAILKHLLNLPAANNFYERHDTLNETVKLILNFQNVDDDTISLSL